MPSIGCRQVYTYIIHAILRIFSWVDLCSSFCVTLVFPRWNLVGAIFLCKNVCVVGWRQGGGTECATLYPRAVCRSGVRRGIEAAFLEDGVESMECSRQRKVSEFEDHWA